MFDTADTYTSVYSTDCKDCSNPWYVSDPSKEVSHKYVTYSNGYKMQAIDVKDKVCLGTGEVEKTVCLEDFVFRTI